MRKLSILVFCIMFTQVGFSQKYEGLAETPPMGWNSWNTFATDINEELIKEMADALIENGMRDAGYEYIVLDDGWEAMERDSAGNLTADPDKFPGGMKALGDYLHDKGFKFGIHNDAGTRTCAGYPGGRGHEYQDARTYASWGVDYLKYDWCNHGTADARETYKTMRDALYAAGRPVVLSICEWGSNEPWIWGPEIGHLWRTTGDVTDCYDCQGVYDMGWKIILDQQVGLSQYAGPGHWNDPDMLEVGNEGLTVAESRAQFSLWAILAAPLMAGNDVRNMSEEIRAILTNEEVISINQDPLGKQGFRYMAHPGKELWAKELSNNGWAVCILSSGDNALDIRLNWDYLPFLDDMEYRIRDLWRKGSIGTTEEVFRREIPSHDVALLRLMPME